jgi:hypothetical protein
MTRPARAERRCRRCPFCAPSGRCRDLAIKSGRCGDWIWFVRYGKQIRRPYIRPQDPRKPAQLRSRAQLGAASKKFSYSLTEKKQAACIAAGAKLQSRPRSDQSGPMIEQQYSVRRQYALQKAHGNAIKTAIAPQVPQRQKLNRTIREARRGFSGAAPDRRRLGARRSRKPRDGTKESRTHEEWGVPTILRCFRWDSSKPAPDGPADPTGATTESRRSTPDLNQR